MHRLCLTALGLMLTATLTALAPSRAVACSFAANPQFVPNPAEVGVDTNPPAAPVEVVATIGRRGAGACSGDGDSCSDLGLISLIVTPGDDDRTPAADIGYRLVLLSGNLPNGLTLPSQAVHPASEDELLLVWIDGSTDSQESFSALIGVIPVDSAGNEGPMFEVRVKDGGAGCETGSGGSGAAAALVVLWFGFRRRQKRAAGTLGRASRVA